MTMMTITIPAPHQRIGHRLFTPLAFPNAHNQVKTYLKDMLLKALKRHESHPDDRVAPIFKELNPSQVVDGMKNQLDAYWRGEWPFDQPIENSDPLAWWKALEKPLHSRILAVSIPLLHTMQRSDHVELSSIL